jgi:hypothetical protein
VQVPRAQLGACFRSRTEALFSCQRIAKVELRPERTAASADATLEMVEVGDVP